MSEMVCFLPDERRVVCTTGIAELDLRADLYGAAKRAWRINPDLASLRFPIRAVGGIPINPNLGIYVPSYFYLLYGWRLRPWEGTHTLRLSGGILLTDEYDSPIVPTLGDYNAMICYSQPVVTETVRIAGGSGADSWTTEQWTAINAIREKVSQIADIESGTWLLQDDTLIFYKPDNATEIMRFRIRRDITGAPVARSRL